jgi:AraC-like DNA-binding protein
MMEGTAADFAPCRFSTSALPERERVPFWREVFARKIVGVDIEPLSEAPLASDMVVRRAPGLCATSEISSAARLLRGSQLVADGDDAIALLMNMAGTMTLSQRLREASLDAGNAVAVLHAEPATMISQGGKFGIIVPRAALASRVKNVEDATMRPIASSDQGLRLLIGYFTAMSEELPLATPALRELVVTHVHDLVAMVIGGSTGADAIANTGSMRAARLAVIKADIAEHIVDRNLTLKALGARQHLTPRYVQKLFEEEGITFSEFVLRQRLARAHGMLNDPRFAEQTISSIAFAAGFGDLSYFNRAFRARYGATPTDVREAAIRSQSR